MHKGIKSFSNNHRPLWIFNLNHDVIIEMLAAEFNIPLQNGFSDQTIELHFDRHASFSAKFKILKSKDISDYLYTYFSTDQQYGINLLKLHGSLDIFGYDDLHQYLCVFPKENSIKGYIKILKNITAIYPSSLPRINNEIVVFDSKGHEQYLRKSLLSGTNKFIGKHYQIVSPKILDIFKRSLSYLEELVVIGYSFSDFHVNDILKEWLEFTSNRSLIIVDPYRQKIPNELAHLYEQVSLHKERGLDYFSKLEGGSLSPDEQQLYEERKKHRTEPSRTYSQTSSE